MRKIPKIKLNSPQVYTVFKYIRESGRHGLPNVCASADIVHRRRPWHNCITVSVANGTWQSVSVKYQTIKMRKKNSQNNHLFNGFAVVESCC